MRARPAAALAAALCAGALLAGCSGVPKAAAMQAHGVAAATRHPLALGVRVSGGQEFDFRISDAEFERALRDSLAESGMFARIVEPDVGDYRLDVVLGDGSGLEAREITVLWSVSRSDTRETVWQELVTSRGRSHHFVGVVRGRRSLEQAAQQNIRLGLEALARANLPAKGP
jgi:hypothetical protein